MAVSFNIALTSRSRGEGLIGCEEGGVRPSRAVQLPSGGQDLQQVSIRGSHARNGVSQRASYQSYGRRGSFRADLPGPVSGLVRSPYRTSMLMFGRGIPRGYTVMRTLVMMLYG